MQLIRQIIRLKMPRFGAGDGSLPSRCARFVMVLAYLLAPLLVGAQWYDSVPSPVGESGSKVQTVVVSRTFDPSVNDANKINFLPRLDDTLELSPNFIYTLYPRPVMEVFPLRPIPPARMGMERAPRLSHFYAKVGFGNYVSPLAEAYFSGGRSEKFTYGVMAQHRSAFGKLRLTDGEFVKAPYSHTQLHAFGDVALQRVAFHTLLYYRHGMDAFYGRFDSLYAEQNALWGTQTQANRFGAQVAFNSTYIDSSHFQYQGRVTFDGYADSRNMGQSHLSAEFAGHKYFRQECFGARANVDYYKKSLRPSDGSNVIVSFTPWGKLFGRRWRVLAGVSLLYENNNTHPRFYFFPKGHVSYDVVKNYFIPYFELDGRLEPADYVTCREENRWILPGLHVWNAARKMEIRGGVKGNFTARMSYNFYASYALVDSVHFYVNRVYGESLPTGFSPRSLLSTFDVLYDNAQEVHAVGELSYSLTHRFSAAARVDYWRYSLQKLETPWHKPRYSGLLRGSYNLRQKVFLSIDFYLEGGMQARGLNGERIVLKPIADLNMSMRYQLFDSFSAFLDLRNMLAFNRSRYYLYPMHRFNGHAGVIFTF